MRHAWLGAAVVALMPAVASAGHSSSLRITSGVVYPDYCYRTPVVRYDYNAYRGWPSARFYGAVAYPGPMVVYRYPPVEYAPPPPVIYDPPIARSPSGVYAAPEGSYYFYESYRTYPEGTRVYHEETRYYYYGR